MINKVNSDSSAVCFLFYVDNWNIHKSSFDLICLGWMKSEFCILFTDY